MQYLNLSAGFDPFQKASSGLIQFDAFKFPGGEVHIKLKGPLSPEPVFISTRLNSSDDIMLLLLAVDALRNARIKEINLFIPYFPYARQDRVMVPGEPLSVKVMATLINAMGFERVLVFDPHSEVSVALINNVEVLDNHSFVMECLADKQNYLIVSPDAGAYKKIFKLCSAIGYKDEIILSNKIRDVSNGSIKNITIDTSDLQGKDVYIVDDICDGGGTFVYLAEKFKEHNAGNINLIVSHGIFSKGEEALIGIDKAYTTDSIKEISSDLIIQKKISINLN